MNTTTENEFRLAFSKALRGAHTEAFENIFEELFEDRHGKSYESVPYWKAYTTACEEAFGVAGRNTGGESDWDSDSDTDHRRHESAEEYKLDGRRVCSACGLILKPVLVYHGYGQHNHIPRNTGKGKRRRRRRRRKPKVPKIRLTTADGKPEG